MQLILKPAGIVLILGILVGLTIVVLRNTATPVIKTSPPPTDMVAQATPPPRVQVPKLPIIDLTTEGGYDWALWGVSDQFRAAGGILIPLRKAIKRPAEERISPVKVVGGEFSPWPAVTLRSFKWSDGDAIARVLQVKDAIHINADGLGFQFTVPPSRQPREMKVYVGGKYADVEFTAQVEGRSTPEKAEMETAEASDGTFTRIYTVRYANTSKPLVVTYRCKKRTNESGDILLQAVALK